MLQNKKTTWRCRLNANNRFFHLLREKILMLWTTETTVFIRMIARNFIQRKQPYLWLKANNDRNLVWEQNSDNYFLSLNWNTHWITPLLLHPSVKQVQKVHETSVFQSGFDPFTPTPINTSGISKSPQEKISFSLIEPQLLPCTPARGYKFHALTFYLHPTFTAHPIESASGI